MVKVKTEKYTHPHKNDKKQHSKQEMRDNWLR